MFRKKLLKDSDKKNIVKKFKLELLVVFGSHADGTANFESDVDFGFYAKESLNQYELADLYVDLSQAVHNRKINVVEMHFDKPGEYGCYNRKIKLIQHAILQNSTILHQEHFGFYEALVKKAESIEKITPIELRDRILKVKLDSIRELVNAMKDHYSAFYTENHRNLSDSEKFDAHFRLNTFKRSIATQVTEQFRKINRFVIKNFIGKRLQSDYKNCQYLCDLLNIEQYCSERLSQSAFFLELTQLDYISGPRLIISWYFSAIENDYPVYLDKLEKYVEGIV